MNPLNVANKSEIVFGESYLRVSFVSGSIFSGIQSCTDKKMCSPATYQIVIDNIILYLIKLLKKLTCRLTVYINVVDR